MSQLPKVKTAARLTDENLVEIETRLARVADVSSFDYAARPAAAQ